jgi:hypothetical protein
MKTFWHNITYAPLKALKEAGVVLGIIFGLCNGIIFFFPNFSKYLTNWIIFSVTVFLSILYGFWKIRKVSKIDFNIPHTNTTIEVLFGDLFKQEGWRAIQVSDFFDSEIGELVSNKTLHGILIEKHLNGKHFDSIVDNQLVSIQAETISEKIRGKQKRYPIGTTVTMETDGKYLLFVLSEIDPKTYKAHCDVAKMWLALEGLLKQGRIKSGGYPINIPLIGSGQSGVGLPNKDLLNLLILSIVTETKKERIADKIRIVLKKDLYEELNLNDLKQYWRK